MSIRVLTVIIFLSFFGNHTRAQQTTLPRPTPNFNMYCNARFAYCINYPGELIAQPESQNGDGRVFHNKQGRTILTVFGRINQDADGNPVSVKKQYEGDLREFTKNAKPGDSITYKTLAKNFYVYSGYKGKDIFYNKIIVKEGAFCFALLRYPINEQGFYDKLTSKIMSPFK